MILNDPCTGTQPQKPRLNADTLKDLYLEIHAGVYWLNVEGERCSAGAFHKYLKHVGKIAFLSRAAIFYLLKYYTIYQ